MEEKEIMAVTCPECGKAFTDSPAFCSRCGTRLAAVSLDDMAFSENEEISAEKKSEKLSFAALQYKTAKERLRIGTKIAAVALAIIMFFTAFFAVTAIRIRIATTPDSIEDIVNRIDIADIEVVVNYSDGTKREDTFGGWLHDQIKLRFGERFKLTEDQLDKLMEESEVKPFLAEEISDIVEDIYDGSYDSKITAEEVREMLLDCNYYLSEEYGYTINTEGAKQVAGFIATDKISDTLSAEYLYDYYPFVYYLLNIGLSVGMIILLVLFVLAYGLFIFLLNEKSLVRTARDIGITLTVLSFIYIAASFFARISLPRILSVGIPNVVATVVGEMMWSGVALDSVLMFIGIGLIVFSRIYKSLILKKQNPLATGK